MSLSLMILLFSTLEVQTCMYSCSKYQYKNFEDRRKFISHLSNSLTISDLALIGTCYSASYNTYMPRFKIQDLNIKEQLNHGIRVLDIGVRPTSNHFAVHNEEKYLNLMFGNGILKEVDDFLEANPRELVIMFLHNEYYAANDVTLCNCGILEFYRNLKIGLRISTNWSLNDTIGEHRGKILLTSLDQSFSSCITNINTYCKVQYSLIPGGSESDIHDKWISIKNLQEESFLNDSGKCFVEFMSAPKATEAKKIAIEGYYSDVYGCETPINYRMTINFDNPHRSLIIVMAEFVNQELIDHIIGSNFENDFISSKETGSKFPLPDDIFYYLEFKLAAA
ncbi:Similar to plcA: 1-phosphatidylinositol phosphodiesterase (Listeria monocytogenes serovar 1/2a (strain ATCC BAA-679 / EGD-e)) [Cotesia congregata]|uniref:Similar to plcA: 1-phosphatidylinositol phosphodiesterase (Listeria monocytogenes serovar 1/2a (Strain ATCC BAA-679 / EGD-e)) n=1 Tax=Cotesia congregata TaxID=51543 RepID=A0A8J2H002_COTCN|nr:Similar to plcA: 1-phosphatidylinositol phosphodiesterase (Listeria monocytogenes serovar 1/2a (strain ATCC BAA-679 / EGD-e)) [Cotesia congregata]